MCNGGPCIRHTVESVAKAMGFEDGSVPNLDAQCKDDLMSFWQVSSRGYNMARFLFPDRPKNYIKVTAILCCYASHKAAAMGCRKEGRISGAITYENSCQMMYDDLPKWARW